MRQPAALTPISSPTCGDREPRAMRGRRHPPLGHGPRRRPLRRPRGQRDRPPLPTHHPGDGGTRGGRDRAAPDDRVDACCPVQVVTPAIKARHSAYWSRTSNTEAIVPPSCDFEGVALRFPMIQKTRD
jgi:hypothetical protein